MKCFYKLDRFWCCYLFVRMMYLLFAVLIFPHVSTVNDPISYMTHPLPDASFSSTNLMYLLGGGIGKILGGFNVLSNLPFALVSFAIIRHVVEKLKLRQVLDAGYLFILLSLPTFCIWTSLCSKETIGLVCSSLLGLLFVRYWQGCYKLYFRDYAALFLCLLFKPQYLPWVIGILLYIRLVRKLKHLEIKVLFSVFYIGCIVGVLYFFRNLIDYYSLGVQYAFSFDANYSNSTRSTDIFKESGDFFRNAPWGMIVAFWGPTLQEAIHKPLHLLAFLESLYLFCYFLYLSKVVIGDFLFRWRFHLEVVMVYITLLGGILLVHYPFGVFNPGSATRYRDNFLFLFVIVLTSLYSYSQRNYEKKLPVI